jgi:SH3-like domain-containing protein
MSYVNAAAAHWAPTDPNRQILANTGTTEAVSTVLPMGQYASLKVGEVAVRVRFAKESFSAMVSSTDVYFAAGETYHWLVQEFSQYVAVEAEDGASAYQVWVWPSSPKV